MAEKMKYVTVYMKGVSYEGIEEGWVPFENLREATRFIDEVKKDSEFWKVSICKILESYENEG